jgi:hypothetical protein
MWPFEELKIKNNPNGKMNTLLRLFGQDSGGEIYVLTADKSGPSGATGKVFKMAP